MMSIAEIARLDLSRKIDALDNLLDFITKNENGLILENQILEINTFILNEKDEVCLDRMWRIIYEIGKCDLLLDTAKNILLTKSYFASYAFGYLYRFSNEDQQKMIQLGLSSPSFEARFYAALRLPMSETMFICQTILETLRLADDHEVYDAAWEATEHYKSDVLLSQAYEYANKYPICREYRKLILILEKDGFKRDKF